MRILNILLEIQCNKNSIQCKENGKKCEDCMRLLANKNDAELKQFQVRDEK